MQLVLAQISFAPNHPSFLSLHPLNHDNLINSLANGLSAGSPPFTLLVVIFIPLLIPQVALIHRRLLVDRSLNAPSHERTIALLIRIPAITASTLEKWFASNIVVYDNALGKSPAAFLAFLAWSDGDATGEVAEGCFLVRGTKFVYWRA